MNNVQMKVTNEDHPNNRQATGRMAIVSYRVGGTFTCRPYCQSENLTTDEIEKRCCRLLANSFVTDVSCDFLGYDYQTTKRVNYSKGETFITGLKNKALEV